MFWPTKNDIVPFHQSINNVPAGSVEVSITAGSRERIRLWPRKIKYDKVWGATKASNKKDKQQVTSFGSFFLQLGITKFHRNHRIHPDTVKMIWVLWRLWHFCSDSPSWMFYGWLMKLMKQFHDSQPSRVRDLLEDLVLPDSSIESWLMGLRGAGWSGVVTCLVLCM